MKRIIIVAIAIYSTTMFMISCVNTAPKKNEVVDVKQDEDSIVLVDIDSVKETKKEIILDNDIIKLSVDSDIVK